jgi:hypothetical protein
MSELTLEPDSTVVKENKKIKIFFDSKKIIIRVQLSYIKK